MSFDYGSIDLGIKNPFKLEGTIIAIRGLIISLAGLYLLISAAGIVKSDAAIGWILMVFGIGILGGGFKDIGMGIYSTLKFFVGRNHPTSLANNKGASESLASAKEFEKAYTAKELEEMLVGRKNITFKEPSGFLSRLLHTLVPKLLFLPYPIRNFSQRLFGVWVETIVALISYGLVAFVSMMGFVGEVGEITFPIYSAFLMIYLLLSWRLMIPPIKQKTETAIERKAQAGVESLGRGPLVKIIALSLIMPVIVGMAVSWIMAKTQVTKVDIDTFIAGLPSLHIGLYLLGLLLLAGSATVILVVMIRKRLQEAKPETEVSELRDNWQASIHPNEIFINLDNLVMANRRYKEVPNRVYGEVDPQLDEQTVGKGSFKGVMLQEIQPLSKPLELGRVFNKMRFTSLILGNLLFIVAAFLTIAFAYSAIDLYQFIGALKASSVADFVNSTNLAEGASLLVAAVHFLLIGFLVKTFARLFSNSAHLFFAEMQFESLLVYFKCDGTFTESKLSTGMSIHDSTRSENTVVRSSITPWVIVSRLTTTVFAASGFKNLEYPRHIMSMHKDDNELASIKDDVMSFLNDREAIASITNERDLGNASQLHQLNQQTRVTSATPTLEQQEQTEQAAGYLRQKDENFDSDSGSIS